MVSATRVPTLKLDREKVMEEEGGGRRKKRKNKKKKKNSKEEEEKVDSVIEDTHPDVFRFNMIRTRTVDGAHKGQTKSYSKEEFMEKKTHEIRQALQDIQSEKKNIEKLTTSLQLVDNRGSNKHTYFAEDREEAKKLQSQRRRNEIPLNSDDIPASIKRKTEQTHKELETSRNRLKQLEETYVEMTMQKELQKKGSRRKLREDELVRPTKKPVYKWHPERKR